MTTLLEMRKFYAEREERSSWDQFVSVAVVLDWPADEAAQYADKLLEERRKRFGSAEDCQP